jgi:transposase-like protein
VAQRRRYSSPQFKAEEVQFVIEKGRPIAEVAPELEINAGMLDNWVNEWKQCNPEAENSSHQ